ncbi:MAG: hypothetical protein ACRDHD_10810, partial [Candidatus Limnocylindria bacterium]
ARLWPGRVALVGIERPRDVLDARIQERAAAMFRSGLVDEVRSLLASGIGRELGPMTGHGYREAARVAAGEITVEAALEITVRHTRQYARRQLTWFRRDARIAWLAAGSEPADTPAVVDAAVERLRVLV